MALGGSARPAGWQWLCFGSCCFPRVVCSGRDREESVQIPAGNRWGIIPDLPPSAGTWTRLWCRQGGLGMPWAAGDSAGPFLGTASLKKNPIPGAPFSTWAPSLPLRARAGPAPPRVERSRFGAAAEPGVRLWGREQGKHPKGRERQREREAARAERRALLPPANCVGTAAAPASWEVLLMPKRCWRGRGSD